MESPNKWWCAYGMHAFQWTNTFVTPVDCPERHAIRTTLTTEMLENRELKEAFLQYKTPVENLSKKQLVELIKLIKVPQEIQD